MTENDKKNKDLFQFSTNSINPIQTKPSKPVSRIANVFLSVAISVLLLVFVFRGFDYSEIARSIMNLSCFNIVLGFIIYYVSFIIRALRWQYMVRNAGGRIPFAVSFSTLLTSFAFNCILPAKAGDIYRAYAADRLIKLGFFTTLGTIVAERIADLVGVLSVFALTTVITFFCRGLSDQGSSGIRLALTSVLIASVVVMILIVFAILFIDGIVKYFLPKKYKLRAFEIKRGFRSSIGNIVFLALFTIVIWFFEFGSIVLVIKAIESPVNILQATFTAVVSTLSNAVPFNPGGLGAFELAARELLTFFRMNLDSALAVIIVLRIINYWSLLIIGAILGNVPLFKEEAK